MFAAANIPEEQIPCANIIIMVPSNPHFVKLSTPTITKAI